MWKETLNKLLNELDGRTETVRDFFFFFTKVNLIQGSRVTHGRGLLNDV